jgi:hypothetical protein
MFSLSSESMEPIITKSVNVCAAQILGGYATSTTGSQKINFPILLPLNNFT